tara:strand:+ start:699 stop:1280 length:582 start_codon:yes stop_codon:yes gene_type:complete
MASPLTQRTSPLYQKDSQLHTHTAPISSIQPLSSLPAPLHALFKPPQASEAYILTTPSTIFHAQGGGQPSDTGTIASGSTTFAVHQVRSVEAAILHLGTFTPPESAFKGDGAEQGVQNIDVGKRLLHSRLHTAGHVIGLAVNQLVREGVLDAGIVDGKASHYPGAAFVEFVGLIAGDRKAEIQRRVDGTHTPH